MDVLVAKGEVEIGRCRENERYYQFYNIEQMNSYARYGEEAVRGMGYTQSPIHYITFSSLHDDKARRFPLLAEHIETVVSETVTADINSKVYVNYIQLTLDPLMTEVATLLGVERDVREQELQMSLGRLNTKFEISEQKHLDFLQQYANLAWWERIWFAIMGLPDNFE